MQTPTTPGTGAPGERRRRHRRRQLVGRRLAVAALVAVVLVWRADGVSTAGDGLLWLVGLGVGAAVVLRVIGSDQRDAATLTGLAAFLAAVVVTAAVIGRALEPLVVGGVSGIAVGWALLPLRGRRPATFLPGPTDAARRGRPP